MKKWLLLSILLLSPLVNAEIRTQEVVYNDGETTLRGFIAWDAAMERPRPGILVVHEWWGLNDYARERARMLAELGYTAMAIDMFGDGKSTDHPQEAQAFVQALESRRGLAEQRFRAAKAVLTQHPSVAAEQIGAIGYCFGGGLVLEMARLGADLDAVVSFHGTLATENPAQEGDVRARILVLNGEEDPMVPAQSIVAFKQEMDAAGVDYQFINYPGATHGFTNPAADSVGKRYRMPLAYDAQADAQSWQAMREFLAETFRSP